jgi:hypothetical protein
VDLFIERSQTQRLILTGPVTSFGGRAVGFVASFHAAPVATPVTRGPDAYVPYLVVTSLRIRRSLSATSRLPIRDRIRMSFVDFISVQYR